MGRCYVSLKEWDQAEECFCLIARENPVDFDSRLRLAEVYEATDRKDEALQVVEAGILQCLPPFRNGKLMVVKRDRELFKHTPTFEPSLDTSSPGALIPNRKPPPTIPTNSSPSTSQSRPIPPKRSNERAALELRLKEHVITSWETLETLKAGMEAGTKNDIMEWMHIAKGLLAEFKAVRSFFPHEKNKRITWFDEDTTPIREGTVLGKRKAVDIEARMEEMQNRLQEQVVERTGLFLSNGTGLIVSVAGS